MEAAEVARQIVECCRQLWRGGLIAGADGNVSVRYRPGRLLVTPRGLPKADLQPGDVVEVDLEGRHLGGCRQATTELDLHTRVYRCRSDCGAVVHAHPPLATAFAVAGEGIPDDVLPEITLLLGPVPVVPYATPGTPASRSLGRVTRLTREQIDDLERLRGTSRHGQSDLGY